MTERKSLESERADDLLHLWRDLIKAGIDDCLTSADIIRNVSLAIRLAAQDQKPVAWVIPGDDNARDNGFIDCMAWKEGEFTKPLYAKPFPPPAAGWAITDDMVMAGARAIADLEDVGVDPLIVEHSKACLKAALRRNAPPDSGAENPLLVVTYTNYRGETSVRRIAPKSIRFGSTEWHPEPQWLLLAHDTEKKADREFALKDFGVPDHGGADAGVKEALRSACLRLQSFLDTFGDIGGAATQAEINDWFELTDQPAPVAAREDDPSRDERWQAGLDFAMTQLCTVMGVDPHDVTWDAATEEVEGDVRAVIWNILRAKMGEDWKPAPVAANASAEAWLREALESCKVEHLKFEEWAAGEKYEMHEHPLHYLFLNEKTYAARQGWKAALRYVQSVLSTRSHASDCDKQGERQA